MLVLFSKLNILATALIFFCFPFVSIHDSLATSNSNPIEEITPIDNEISPAELLKLLPQDRYIGNKEAPVLMISYSSLSCFHCADFFLKVLPEIEKKYIRTGKLLFIFRNFPLEYKSLKASMLGFCYKGPKDYFTYTKAVFSSIESLIASGNDLQILHNIARISNISDELYEKCISSEQAMNYIIQEKLLAIKKLNVNATPAFFINGKRYDNGYSLSSFINAIDDILATNKNILS